MKTVYAIAIWVCLIALLAECNDLTTFIIVKAIALALAIIFGKLLDKSLTKEDTQL